MGKWICYNDECDRCNLEVNETVEVISFTDEGKVNSATKCPRCGGNRKEVLQDGDYSKIVSIGHNISGGIHKHHE